MIHLVKKFLPLAIVIAVLVVGYSLLKPISSLKGTCRDCNVVFILIDTLRGDHLGFAGYEKDTSPFLDGLAEKSIIFDRAFSASSTTAPATASIYTSLYPSEHGMITGHIATRHLQKNHPDLQLNRIPEELNIMPELFKSAGYKTYSIADNLNVCEEMGFAQGYDKFETYRYEGAEVVNNKLMEWKDEILNSGKFFLYLHYMDPHKPYNKQAPWFKPSDNKRERVINAYDSEINYVDDKIKEVFEAFKFSENTLVVVTSDHGEEFGEHGGHGHGKTLYREVINVPLFIYHPKLKSKRIKTYVHTMDILPTLMDLIGVEKDENWTGISLAALMNGAADKKRPHISELLRKKEHKKSSKRSIIEEAWHYIETTKLDNSVHGELYNLANDFNEKHNKHETEAEKVSKLQASLKDFDKTKKVISQQEVSIPVDEEMLDQLSTLGYME